LLDFIRELRALDLPVKLSTNGSRPAVVKTLLQENLLACLGFDYKAPLDERLAAVSGADDVAAARESYALARAALKSGAAPEVEFHTTLCPQFIDRKIIAEMTEQLDGAGALWILQQYENDVERLDAGAAGAERYSREELDALAEIARRGAARVLLRYGK
jgi:pyruvate formate lyase activating enzyme